MILKLLSYNIRFGGSGRESRLAEVIRTVSPDLVVFQEATDTRVIEGLAKATDFPFWAAQRAHSIAYLSRVEVSYHEWHYPAGAKHSFLEIVLAGTEARIFGLHLSSMFSKWSERRRAREIRALLNGIERHQQGLSCPGRRFQYSGSRRSARCEAHAGMDPGPGLDERSRYST